LAGIVAATVGVVSPEIPIELFRLDNFNTSRIAPDSAGLDPVAPTSIDLKRTIARRRLAAGLGAFSSRLCIASRCRRVTECLHAMDEVG